ncbi:MAG TPA: outer membrane beta-barrel protein, partial [Thermoanaerobaculia bacterium]|nr:outer membrane beta-barrel protein [Thermoanaerobaculia bacterium]
GMIYPIKLPKVGVYLLGGGTYSNLKVKGTSVVQGEATEKGWSTHVGAGIDLKIGEKTTLNGDVRAVFLDASSVDELFDSVQSNYKGDFWTVTLGLNYKLF